MDDLLPSCFLAILAQAITWVGKKLVQNHIDFKHSKLYSKFIKKKTTLLTLSKYQQNRCWMKMRWHSLLSIPDNRHWPEPGCHSWVWIQHGVGLVSDAPHFAGKSSEYLRWREAVWHYNVFIIWLIISLRYHLILTANFYKHEAFKSKLIPLEFADYCQFQNLQYGLLYHTNLIYLIRLAPYILFLQGHLYSYCKSNRLYGHKSADYVEILTKAVSGWNVNFNTGFKGLWRLTQV